MKEAAYGRLFIAVEGMDGSGKGTLINGLRTSLASIQRTPITVTREPGGTELGIKLRSILLSANEPTMPTAELLLYAADRAQHIETVIRPILDRNEILLTDRYVGSTFAYQGGGRGHSMEKLNSLFELSCGDSLLWPDITIVIDVPVEIGLSRAKGRLQAEGKQVDEGKFEGLAVEFHQRVRETYIRMAEYVEGNPEPFYEGHYVCVVDGLQAPKIVLETAVHHIKAYVRHMVAEKHEQPGSTFKQ